MFVLIGILLAVDVLFMSVVTATHLGPLKLEEKTKQHKVVHTLLK